MKHKPCIFNESKFYMVRKKQLNIVKVGLRTDDQDQHSYLRLDGWNIIDDMALPREERNSS